MESKNSIAGYIRVSSGKQVKEGESLQEQRRMIEEYAKIYNYSVFKIYSDEGISGTVSDRPALEELKRDANLNRFNKVIFFGLDRFGRSAQDLLNNYDFFEKRSVHLLSLRENIDTSTATGRFLRTVLGAVAELEREMIRDRVIMGMGARIKSGRKPVARVPYGYAWNKKEENFQIIEGEKEAYEAAVKLFLIKGKSLTEVAGILNEKGYRTKEGKRFTQPSLSLILKNPFYKGEWLVNFQGEKFSYSPPPLIDRNTWKKIQDRIGENVNKPKNYDPEKDPFLLRGLIKCECGSMLSCGTYQSRGNKYRYYKCLTSKMTPKSKLASNPYKICSLPYIKASDIENYVLGSILGYFQFPENLVKRWAENIDSSRKEGVEYELHGIKIKIGKKEAERKRLIDLYTVSSVDRSLLEQKDGELKVEMDLLNDKKEQLSKELGLIGKAQEQLEWLNNVGKDLRRLWPEINKAFLDMTELQRKEFIIESLAGEKLEVRILRRRDVLESEKGFSKEELNAPVYKKVNGQEVIDWIMEGDWNFNLNAAAQYLKPLINLNSEYIRKVNLPSPR